MAMGWFLTSSLSLSTTTRPFEIPIMMFVECHDSERYLLESFPVAVFEPSIV
jgi:hypothetical protein